MREREVLVLLGGNVGDPQQTLLTAEKLLEEQVGRVVARSRDHWTEPVGFEDDRMFLNRALVIRSNEAPLAIMEKALELETKLGRIRDPEGGVGPRTIDIDLLGIDDLVLSDEHLTLPHPRMHTRRFALAPLADVRPDWVHPRSGRTCLDLLNTLPL